MKCHICDKRVDSFIDEKTDIEYFHCTSCEYIFKNPLLYQKFSEQKDRYNLHDNSEESSGYRAYFQRFLDFLFESVSDFDNVLDFGCGASHLLSNMFEEQGVKASYYDPIYYPDSLNIEAKYDLVVSTEVFEHLHNPKDILIEISSYLKPNGYVAIQTQFHPNNIDRFKEWYYHKDPTHIVFFRPKTFEVLSLSLGYKVISSNDKNMIILQKV